MTETVETKEVKEDDYLSIFYPPRQVPEYEIGVNDELLKLAFDLKEKRKSSVEGLLYLISEEANKTSDQLLSGEKELFKKEKDKYIQYLIQKHQRWLPTELKRDKLVRRVRRIMTMKAKDEDKKGRKKNENGDEKEDLNLDGSQNMEEIEEFEDEQDLSDYANDRFNDDEYRGGGSDGGDGDGYD